ncbi:MAG: DUF4013 domain-containing protein [Eggerthellaceae bacterium]|nr:DUF4013 domain-containing protein [Eggerthellaceae bacterium]
MQCQSCSSVVPDNAKFCTECGAALLQEQMHEQEVAPVEVAPAMEPQQPIAESEETLVLIAQPQQPSSDVEGEPVFNAQPQQPFDANPQYEYQPDPQPEPQPASYAASQTAPQEPVYAQGCIAAAWQDVKNSPGWFSRTALLGVIQCVPILSFFALGYALNWAREVPFGGKTVMPQRIFTSANFEMGFYSFLITIVFSIVGTLCAGVLGFIPIIGGLAGVALSAGLMAFAYLCCVRVGIKQRLGEGFKLGEIWAAVNRNPMSFLAASLVPIVVSCVMVAVILGVGTVLSMGAALPFMFFGDVAFMIFGLLAFFCCLILYVVCCMVIAAATLVTDRALAHWVGRYAPEWIA